LGDDGFRLRDVWSWVWALEGLHRGVVKLSRGLAGLGAVLIAVDAKRRGGSSKLTWRGRLGATGRAVVAWRRMRKALRCSPSCVRGDIVVGEEESGSTELGKKRW